MPLFAVYLFLNYTFSFFLITQQTHILELECQNAKLTQDLKRLKEHLINIEESYTQELLLAEDREKELRDKNVRLLQQLEQQQSNNEANTLREKLASAIVDRDRALTEASTLDDRLQQASAHIERLQLVLEQTHKGMPLSLSLSLALFAHFYRLAAQLTLF